MEVNLRIVTLVNVEEKKMHIIFSSLHLSSHPCHVRAIEDATFRNQWCQIGAFHGSVKTQHCFFFGCIHLLQVANFYVSYPFQSLVVKKWRHSQLYLEKFKISTLINKCPEFPGNSWQKELAKKKKVQIQRTQICSLPPRIATNMEVNLRIVTLVNVEEKKYFFCATVKGGGVNN